MEITLQDLSSLLKEMSALSSRICNMAKDPMQKRRLISEAVIYDVVIHLIEDPDFYGEMWSIYMEDEK